LEPFGERAAYWRTGLIAATVANAHRGKRGRAYRPEDFMPPEPKPERRSQSPDEMAAVLRKAYEVARRRGLMKQIADGGRT